MHKTKQESEKKIVSLMIRMYCRGNHHTDRLCPECAALTEYAVNRVDHCPHAETKTSCGACKTHCYRPDMREKIRAVMRWSGPRMIFHHPILCIRHLADVKHHRQL